MKSGMKVVLIGASTGGPGIIEALIRRLPSHFPCAVCIVQHFPAELTHSFAARLATLTPHRVVESSDGMPLEEGTIVVARGGRHTIFRFGPDGGVVLRHVNAGSALRDDFIPSVDVMFASALQTFMPQNICAVLLSGIGDDGAAAMEQVAAAGGMAVCQDEGSAPVFGMPRSAIERGGATHVLDPERIAAILTDFGQGRS